MESDPDFFSGVSLEVMGENMHIYEFVVENFNLNFLDPLNTPEKESRL